MPRFMLTLKNQQHEFELPSTGDQGEEETVEFKKYLNGKPQDLFTYFKDQGL